MNQPLLSKEPSKRYRFVDREGTDERSYGRFGISKTGEKQSSLYLDDWFHSYASLSTGVVIVSILSAYMISILFWAMMFYFFRSYGFIDIHCYLNALIISLETITTVGYTVSDISFNDNPVAFVLLFCEMMQSIFMNSFCIGVIYARVSRALTRARSIIFSKRAVIREINGEWYFMFQICERRKHQLIESHVTCYSVQKTVNSESGVPFQIRRMKLDHPNDSYGGYLLLILPAVVIHHIDADSPLYPLIHNQSNESKSELTEALIREFLVANDIEIVVMIEGAESVTSRSLQARYSYMWTDISYNMTFAPCVSISEKREAVIDFNRFHKLISLDSEQPYHQDIYIQSIIFYVCQ